MKKLFLLLSVILFISGCSEDESETRSPVTSGKSGEDKSTTMDVSKSMSQGTGVYKMVDGIRIVDHSRDEKEFELRRSIWGVKSMIKTGKEQGVNTSDLESKLANLEKELSNLISG